MNRPSKMMVEHLNLKLKEEGTCLQYVEKRKDIDITTYEIRVIDKYLDYKNYNMNLNISNEFKDMVRLFFKRYGVENIGFDNTVSTIFTID